MCITSAILDYGRHQWPTPNPWVYQPVQPLVPSPVDWSKFKELLEKAAEFDRVAKQPDCEDPEKVKWFDTMEKRMKKLETLLDKIEKKL